MFLAGRFASEKDKRAFNGSEGGWKKLILPPTHPATARNVPLMVEIKSEKPSVKLRDDHIGIFVYIVQIVAMLFMSHAYVQNRFA